MNIHHKNIGRIVKKYNLEYYTPFDEIEDEAHLYQNFEWLYEEDKLEEILYGAFDGEYLLNRSLSEDSIRLGKYVRDKYGSLKLFFIKKGFKEVMSSVKVLCKCGRYTELTKWYEDKSRLWGIDADCSFCRYSITLKYCKNNPDKIFEMSQKRRKNSEALPLIKFDKSDWINKRKKFKWGCALSGVKYKITMDHFIPIISGQGGTYSENLTPIAKSLNASKNDSNPFEWIKLNVDYLRNFEVLVDYLSKENSLTSFEFKNFVYWCFENRRTIDEIHADPRHSIEIWREATGIQFPLPAYVYKPRVNDNLNEIGNRSIIGSFDEINETNEGGSAS